MFYLLVLEFLQKFSLLDIYLHEGAGFTPIAVPISCLHVEEWNSNKLCLRSISISLTIKSDFGDPSVASFMHWMPSSCGMLV